MIGIIDYGMGNLSSVKNILDFLEIDNVIIEDPKYVPSMKGLIIPGVGSFQRAMQNLTEKGFVTPIQNFANLGKPILGICLGMQLLANIGTEPEECLGLGLIPGRVELMKPENLRIPHMGWNGIKIVNEHPIFEEVKTSADFYFVHSFAFVVENESNLLSVTEYGNDFPSIVANDSRNVIGIQFHPEKSQKQGTKILENFSKLVNA
jgi:glutamine amidotransferase